MSFRDIEIKTEYRSFSDNIINDFYIPLLSKATIYKRAVGFFSSSALIEISKGISGLIKNGGKIQLIASPKLSEEDIEAIQKGFELRKKIIDDSINRAFEKPKSIFEEQRLNLLANLIANGQLDIKIAFIEENHCIGIFHEKMGLMTDTFNNRIAFTGSMNESKNAFSYNYESIDVFCSWTHDYERVENKERAFDSIWNDDEPNIITMEFTKIAKEKLESYKKNEEIDLDIDERELYFDKNTVIRENGNTNFFLNKKEPVIPKTVEIREYQLNAIDKWEKFNFQGIFDMATGTGKTYTGLAAVERLYRTLDRRLAVIIVAPYQHLVNQWVDDIEEFGMKPIIGHSSSQQTNWKKRLNDAIRSFNLSINNHFCFICTNATYSSEYVQSLLRKLENNTLLMVDEAHNFGAEKLSKLLLDNFQYRLALSATIVRNQDEEGTNKLYSYFGNKCIEYSLSDAINSNMLTPYYYYPVVVSLNEDELEEYVELSKKIIGRHNDQGKRIYNDYEKMLLIKRARIVAGAEEKIGKLRQEIEKYKDDSHILVYCGATTIKDPNYKEGFADEEEKKQINIVSEMLGNQLGMKISKFTSEESAKERDDLKAAFDKGDLLQALVAIRCLDEGVNIPSIKTAFILASSTNPKEYIQRRGRVLRKHPGKTHAKIYDFITLPIPTNDVSKYNSEVVNTVKGLVFREIARMKDFANISENPWAVDGLINDIENNYSLNLFKGDEQND